MSSEMMDCVMCVDGSRLRSSRNSTKNFFFVDRNLHAGGGGKKFENVVKSSKGKNVVKSSKSSFLKFEK
jgi:hypothetical protein